MAGKRHDPFRHLVEIQEQLNRLFADEPDNYDVAPAWTPPVDIYEAGDRYVLQAEVPGMDAESIQIQIDENQLRIHGERKLLISDAQKYHLVESPHGQFRRSFQFPVLIQADKIRAQLSEGILTIDLPKQLPDGTRKITIG